MRTVAALVLALFVIGLPASLRAADGELVPGLVAEYFNLKNAPGDFPKLTPDMKPYYVRVDPQINFEAAVDDFYGIKLSNSFCARWTGVLRVEKGGSYGFSTESDDGSRLSINGKMVVNNGGVHPMQAASGKLDLTAGAHARAVAREAGIALEEGVYAGLLGPSYETPAEVRMLERLGADAVGMSTVPEVVAARARGIRCLGFSSITNPAAGLTGELLSHQEVLAMGKEIARVLGVVIRGVLRTL